MCIDFGVLWQSTKGLLNSTFFTTVFTAIASSMAGAFAGAYGAQRIVARGKERDELLTEIRNTNAATVIALAVCNTFVAIKKQHVKALKESFDKQKVDYVDRVQKYLSGQLDPSTPPAPVLFNLQLLMLPPFPIDILCHQVFGNLSLNNRRPLMLVNALSETIHGLHTSVTNRNRLIDSYSSAGLSTDDLLPLYFGLPQERTHVINLTYPALIDAIYKQTDDAIFCGKLLCLDLFEHNKHLTERFKHRFRRGVPGTIDKPDFTTPENEGLMPNDTDYADWFTLVRKAKPSDSHRKSISGIFSTAFHRFRSRIKCILGKSPPVQ